MANDNYTDLVCESTSRTETLWCGFRWNSHGRHWLALRDTGVKLTAFSPNECLSELEGVMLCRRVHATNEPHDMNTACTHVIVYIRYVSYQMLPVSMYVST